MTVEALMATLAFGTLLAVTVFGFISARRTEARRKANTQKSTLAADAPSRLPSGVKPVDT